MTGYLPAAAVKGYCEQVGHCSDDLVESDVGERGISGDDEKCELSNNPRPTVGQLTRV